MSWLLGLALWGKTPVWLRKIGIYGIALLICFWIFKLWLNKHDDKVFQEGKVAAITEIDEAKRKEWEEEKRKLESEKRSIIEEAQEVAMERESLKAQATELSRLRRTIDINMAKTLALVQSERKESYERADIVPPDQLDAALRAQSRKLASTANNPR